MKTYCPSLKTPPTVQNHISGNELRIILKRWANKCPMLKYFQLFCWTHIIPSIEFSTQSNNFLIFRNSEWL